MGNRKKCEAACKEALLAGRNVVIDRVNFNEQQRAIWVHLGRAVCGSALQLIVLQLVVPIETCKQRMRDEARKAAAATGGAPKDTDHLVDRWARWLEVVCCTDVCAWQITDAQLPGCMPLHGCVRAWPHAVACCCMAACLLSCIHGWPHAAAWPHGNKWLHAGTRSWCICMVAWYRARLTW